MVLAEQLKSVFEPGNGIEFLVSSRLEPNLARNNGQTTNGNGRNDQMETT